MATIITNPQASIATYVTTSSGARRKAMVTSKQFIFNKVRDLHWHNVSEFTSRINHNGFRGRIAELSAAGFVFNRRYAKDGRLTHIQLTSLPGIGGFTTGPSRND